MPIAVIKRNDSPIFRFLDTAGDGTGTKNAIGNYATPTDFYIQPPENETFYIARILVMIKDAGSFDSGSYGNGITLTNGIDVIHSQAGVETSLVDGVKVFTNTDWANNCYDITISSFGSGNEYLNARWTFEKSGGVLVLKDTDKLIVRLNDDLSDLIEHRFKVDGRKDVE